MTGKILLVATDVLFGGMVMAMSVKDKALVSVAAETVRGDLGALERAYDAALSAGWSTQELKEAGTQAYAYCGFPRSLNALSVLMKVAPEKSGGVNPSRPDGDSLTRGTKVQTELCGGPVKGALFDFAPAIDDYLKAHLFGDIFGRGILTWREREIVTVAMLAALGNVKPQLDAHIGIAKHNGVTDDEIGEILALVNNEATVSSFEMIFRISEVEVHPEYVESYLPFAAEVASESVKTEPGVVSIFPMQDKKNPCQFRIIEIYADGEAYKAHVASAHFQKYKQGTLHMVKRLELLDHEPLVSELKEPIFKKLNKGKKETGK